MQATTSGDQQLKSMDYGGKLVCSKCKKRVSATVDINENITTKCYTCDLTFFYKKGDFDGTN